MGAIVAVGVNTDVAAGVGMIGAGVNTDVASGVDVVDTGVTVGVTTGSAAPPALPVPLREAADADACCCSTDKFVNNIFISVISFTSVTVLSP